MTLANPKKASKFFTAKMEFTTGPVELDSLIKQGENINIVDVRNPEDYELGHVPCAINICRSITKSMAGLSKDKVNIIYCYSEECHLAAAAAKSFAEHGFSVMELEGGFDAWEKHNLPIEI
jgi:rhodanese-related sulfurtransferase